jgi:hypothetical protein
MRISDLIAAVALLIALVGAFLIHRQNKRLATPNLSTSVKISQGTAKKRGRKGESDEKLPPYSGTFTVNSGSVALETVHFLLRRKTNEHFIEFHAYSAVFDPPRERPMIERGHMIHATPADIDRFKEALAEAETVLVEFQDTTGQVFRSPEIAVK